MKLPWQLQKRTNAPARYHLDGGMQLYASSAIYTPQVGRLVFQRSRIQTLTGDPRAQSTLHGAFVIRRRIMPYDNQFAEELTEADFDKLVGIWER